MGDTPANPRAALLLLLCGLSNSAYGIQPRHSSPSECSAPLYDLLFFVPKPAKNTTLWLHGASSPSARVARQIERGGWKGASSTSHYASTALSIKIDPHAIME